MPEDPTGLARSKRVIAARLKAGVARHIWGDLGYYRILLQDDPMFRVAREQLGSGRLAATLDRPE